MYDNVLKVTKAASAALVIFLCSAHTHANDWVPLDQGRAVLSPKSSKPKPSSTQVYKAKTPQSSGQSQLMAELLQRIEMLQQEVADLRERSDQQENQIAQMKDGQQQRYLDLDQRLSELYKRTPANNRDAQSFVIPADGASNQTPVGNGASVNRPSSESAPVLTSSGDAKNEYNAAMSLVRNKQFAQASDAFASFTKRYPNHALAGNAWYWLGEVYLIDNKADLAFTAFERVLNDYPEHNKVADALYKSAVVAHRQGKIPVAKKRLQRVIDEYHARSPNVANLAKSYLSRLSQ